MLEHISIRWVGPPCVYQMEKCGAFLEEGNT